MNKFEMEPSHFIFYNELPLKSNSSTIICLKEKRQKSKRNISLDDRQRLIIDKRGVITNHQIQHIYR